MKTACSVIEFVNEHNLDNVIAIDIWPFGCWNMKTACSVIEFVNEHTPTEETKIP